MNTKKTFHPVKKLLIEEKDYNFFGLILTQVRKYFYDENDRLVEIISLDRDDTCLYTIKNRYNNKGQKFAESKISNNPKENTEQLHLHDGNGRVTSTYGKFGSGHQYLHEFTYDKDGKQIVLSMGTLAHEIDIYQLYQQDLKRQQRRIDGIEAIYLTNPQYVKDTLHLNYFKTVLYYEKKMEHFQKLKITGNLMLPLSVIQYATAYTEENGNYKFELMTGFLGLPSKAPFILLYNNLIKTGFYSTDIDDMYERFYKSENALLINLSERFKDYDISVSKELYEFIHRPECDPQQNWKISDLQSKNWNYNLLALNKTVWEKAFDKAHIDEIFLGEKTELDKIDEGRLTEDGLNNYITGIDSLIDKKLK